MLMYYVNGFIYFMFVLMNNININKENWIKTVRRLYSAVNELIDILSRDISERGFNKKELEEKIQAYVNYFDDNKEFTKLKNSDKDKNFLASKVKDDLINLTILSSSKEDAVNAKDALEQLSDVTSTDVMDVLKSCIDDGWKVGKYTKYAKKKLIMNNVPSIYEKEETNNWTELYYNVVHWKYQILQGDKIYTTKRGSVEKKQDVDLQEIWETGKVVDTTKEQIEKTTRINDIKLEDVENELSDTVDVEKATEQPKKIDTMSEMQKEENKQLEGGVEWSEERIIDELKKIQDVEWYEDLKRCNDVELPFLAKQLLKSDEAIELLKSISISKNSEWNEEELKLKFKSVLDKLLANIMVNTKYFDEWSEELKSKTAWSKSFEEIKKDLSKELWIDQTALNNLKTISEYMSFISFINSIKNSVINVNKKIKWVWRWSLASLLNKCKKECEDNKIKDELKIRLKMNERVNEYLGWLLNDEIGLFESLCEKEEAKEKENKASSDKMEKLKNKIESDFDLLVLKDGEGGVLKDGEGNCLLSEIVKKRVSDLVFDYRNKGELNIDGLKSIFSPVFVKMWMFSKNNDDYPHDRLNFVDIDNFTCEEKEAWWNITYPVIKYVINWETIELKISKLKDFQHTVSWLTHNYYIFKNVVLYAISKTIEEHGDKCPYGIDYNKDCKDDKIIPYLMVYDNFEGGNQFFEDSHYGKKLQKFFEGNLEVNNDNNPTEKKSIEKEGEKGKVKGKERKGESQKKWKGKGKKDKVSEWKENAENLTIEDIVDFYVNNKDEREKLKDLKKKGRRDQRDCSTMRRDYKVKIKDKKGIGLWDMEKIVIGTVSSKPYIDKNFDKFLEELNRLISKK